MNLENVHYDAFISYRHCELDMFVAKNLHKTLEAFKLPAGVAKEHPELKKKIERVFRDQEELPLVSNLAEPIMEALHNSDNLIVICTPRLRESMWCQKEVETFISLHGREHVYAVLAEGEPSESFPPQLLVDESGEPTEPLGADFRGKTSREIKKKMKTESLRLLAPMFGLNYDDLRQRHREQKAKRTISICTIVIAFLLAIGIYSTSMALMIKQQANEIEERNEQITVQNTEIEKQNIEIKEKSHDIALKYALSVAVDAENVIRKGDKAGAVRMLRDALPEDKNDELLPYTPECERMLANCLGVYFGDNSFFPAYTYRAENSIGTMGLSDDGSFLFYIEEGGKMTVVDTASNEEIYTVQLYESITFHDACFCGNYLFYSDENSELHRYDADTGEDSVVLEKLSGLRRVEGHDYIYGFVYGVSRVIEANTGEVVSDLAYREEGNYDYPTTICMSEDESLLFAELKPIVKDDGLDGKVQIIDMTTGNVKDEILFGPNCNATAMVMEDNILYMALEEYVGPLDSTGYIAAYDLSAGRFLYKTKDSNRVLNTLRVCDINGQKYLFGVDYYQPFTFDIKTGELLYSDSVESYIAASFDLGGGDEALILKNGSLAFYIVDTGLTLGTDYFVFPFNEDVTDFQMAKGIFVFHSLNSNVIGVYRTAVNSLMEEIDPETEYQTFSIECKEIDIPSHNLKLIEKNGDRGLYDENGNCIADLKACSGYDEVNDRLIFILTGDYYAMPIYSYEELLKAADEYLE